MKKVPYTFKVGSMMYIIVCTKPILLMMLELFVDFSLYLIKIIGEQCCGFSDTLKALQKRACLCYVSGQLMLESYTNTNIKSDIDSIKSTSDHIRTFVGGVVFWPSKLK